jgi:hypothetical protein
MLPGQTLESNSVYQHNTPICLLLLSRLLKFYSHTSLEWYSITKLWMGGIFCCSCRTTSLPLLIDSCRETTFTIYRQSRKKLDAAHSSWLQICAVILISYLRVEWGTKAWFEAENEVNWDIMADFEEFPHSNFEDVLHLFPALPTGWW